MIMVLMDYQPNKYMSNETVFQREKKNHNRPKVGEMGYVSSIMRGINQWKVCKTCGKKALKENMGRNQRQWKCFDCQPRLFTV